MISLGDPGLLSGSEDIVILAASAFQVLSVVPLLRETIYSI
jgi:hypothetical protein